MMHHQSQLQLNHRRRAVHNDVQTLILPDPFSLNHHISSLIVRCLHRLIHVMFRKKCIEFVFVFIWLGLHERPSLPLLRVPLGRDNIGFSLCQ